MKKKGIKIFTPLEVQRFLRRSKIATRFLVHRLKKQEIIIRLKNGLYAFPDERISDLYIANKLCEPSYISLEFALSYYGIIPETVYTITSVTPRGTKNFTALDKIFTYRHVKKNVFNGYTTKTDSGFTFLIAEPEKALVDLIYFRLRRKMKTLDRIKIQKLDRKKVIQYATAFQEPRLLKALNTIFYDFPRYS